VSARAAKALRDASPSLKILSSQAMMMVGGGGNHLHANDPMSGSQSFTISKFAICQRRLEPFS